MHQAIRDGIITKCEGLYTVDAPKHTETKKEFLTFEELKGLSKVECKYDVLKRAFLFSALSGLRWSDVNALTWTDVRFSEQLGWAIHFTQQKTHQQRVLGHKPTG